MKVQKRIGSTSFYAACLFAILSSSACSPVADSQLKVVTDPPANYTAQLGQGWNMVYDEPKERICISGSPIVQGSYTVELSALQNIETMNSSSVQSIKASLEGIFKGVSAQGSVDLSNEFSTSSTSLTSVVVFTARGKKVQLDLASISAIDDSSINSIVCGDSFIKEIEYGAGALLSVKAYFSEESVKTEFTSGFSLGDILSTVDGSASYEQIKEQFASKMSLDIKIYSAGVELSGAGGPCDFAQIEQCVQTYNDIVNQFKSIQSNPDYLEQNANQVSYDIVRYDTYGLAIPSASTLDRLKYLISRDITNYYKDRQKASNYLSSYSSYFTDATNSALETVYAVANTSIQDLSMINDFCEFDYASCYTDYRAFRTNVASSYDNSVLDMNFDLYSKDVAIGGTGGEVFDMEPTLKASPDTPKRLNSITLIGGSRVDSIQLSYADSNFNTTLGGTGGSTEETLYLEQSEYISSVDVYTAIQSRGASELTSRVVYMKITTNMGKTIAVGSEWQQGLEVTHKQYLADEGEKLIGFHGREGSEIDKLGPIFTTAY